MAPRKSSASLSKNSLKRKNQRKRKRQAGYESTTLNIKKPYKDYLLRLAEVKNKSPSDVLEIIIRAYKVRNPIVSIEKQVKISVSKVVNKNR